MVLTASGLSRLPSQNGMQCGSIPTDVYLLADTTGSMDSYLSSVSAGALQIVNSLSANITDIAFGAGDYKDFRDPYAFRNAAPITADGGVAAQTAINAWHAGGGDDAPEEQLFALWQVGIEALPVPIKCWWKRPLVHSAMLFT